MSLVRHELEQTPQTTSTTPSSCRATRLCWNWAAAAQSHPRHHQVVERRGWGCAAAARLHPRRCPVAERRRWALVGVVTGTRKTHIITFVDVFRCFVTTTRLQRRLRHCPGRLLCGRRVAAPPGRHCRAEFFCAFHDTTTLLNDDAIWLSLLQVLGVGASSQDTW